MSWAKEVFAKNLRYYMEREGLTQKELSDVVGVSAPTFSDWINGKIYPRIDKVERLADYFGILKSDLIEEKSDEYRDMQKKNGTIASAALKMQTNDKFFSVVEAAMRLDDEKLDGLLRLLK